LPVPRTGAPVAVVLARQLQADEQSNQKTEEPLHVSMWLKKTGKKKEKKLEMILSPDTS
jgi:hypothetical protein